MTGAGRSSLLTSTSVALRIEGILGPIELELVDFELESAAGRGIGRELDGGEMSVNLGKDLGLARRSSIRT